MPADQHLVYISMGIVQRVPSTCDTYYRGKRLHNINKKVEFLFFIFSRGIFILLTAVKSLYAFGMNTNKYLKALVNIVK